MMRAFAQEVRRGEGVLIMRQKAENETRDRYARRYAAVLAVDALIQYRAKGVEIVIVVEAEDNPLWDDIVQVNAATSKRRRHQVKRQQTPLTEEGFAKYIKTAAGGDPGTDYHFALAALIQVSDAGDLPR
jgi:hypothetical protein